MEWWVWIFMVIVLLALGALASVIPDIRRHLKIRRM